MVATCVCVYVLCVLVAWVDIRTDTDLDVDLGIVPAHLTPTEQFGLARFDGALYAIPATVVALLGVLIWRWIMPSVSEDPSAAGRTE